MKLKIKKLIPDLDLRYHSDGASGIDISCTNDIVFDNFFQLSDEEYSEQDEYGNRIRGNLPSTAASIPTGFCLEIPYGYEGQIRPRSSITKRGINIHFGTIDSDYRGEVYVQASLINDNLESFDDNGNNLTDEGQVVIKKGERIAQLVICPVQRCDIEFVDELSDTKRGSGGFGSTGK